MSIAPQRVAARPAILIFCAVFAIAMGFALYTHHAWEDYYITYRCSKNLALGHGMVFTPGERVHAFTSPLNTLIPAALNVMTGNCSDRLVLWLFRAISAGCLAGAAVLFYQIAQTLGMGRWATFAWIGLLATGPGIVDFTINGQEVGLMMFFLALSVHALMVPTGRFRLRLGLAWTGLMWTRPDSCVYIAAMAAAFWVFNAGSAAQRTRWELLKTFLVAGALTALLYLPWVVWAWSYFGSAVPHTVVAKGFGHHFTLAEAWQKTCFLAEALYTANFVVLALIFAPPYGGFAGWPSWMHTGCGLLTFISALYCLLPFADRQARALSLTFLLGAWYLALLPLAFPWYLPNTTIFGTCVIGMLIHQLAQLLGWLASRDVHGEILRPTRDWFVSRGGMALRAAALAGPAFSAVVLVLCAMQLRVQQREVELGNRMQIGLWLREHASSPKDSVFLEPLGYIGFFSQLKMYDWPGLCSPEVVAARRRASSWSTVIDDLKPDWLVLRPSEVELLKNGTPPVLAKDYQLARVFDVSERIKAYRYIPGRSYPECDQRFSVYRRVKPSDEAQRVAAKPAR
jgi:hypothetical protein